MALAAYPREQVASLYGRDWIRFLEETVNGELFASGLGDALTGAVCAGNKEVPISDEQCRQLIEFSSQWIRKHKPYRRDVE